ncbi:hypothetical protein T03_5655 [Trichinella britovi]|uniref:Uncharacterized protein n=1 Tax=Trichinella britovi TaxID=45882 RepID=A0A0V1D7P4_TRIBR|nr:hypothetical protein T03_5655 [Trichinella britovi]
MSAECGNFSSGKQTGMLPSSSFSEIMVRSLSMAKLGILSLFSVMEIGSITFKIPWVGPYQLKWSVSDTLLEHVLDVRMKSEKESLNVSLIIVPMQLFTKYDNLASSLSSAMPHSADEH